jgi:hypothetical protein
MALHNATAVLLHPLNDTVPGNTVKPKPIGTCPANAEANNGRWYEDRTWHLKFSTSATVKTKLHAGDSANIELADRVPDEASGLLHGPRFGSRARLVVSSMENGRNGRRNRAKPVRYAIANLTSETESEVAAAEDACAASEAREDSTKSAPIDRLLDKISSAAANRFDGCM